MKAFSPPLLGAETFVYNDERRREKRRGGGETSQLHYLLPCLLFSTVRNRICIHFSVMMCTCTCTVQYVRYGTDSIKMALLLRYNNILHVQIYSEEMKYVWGILVGYDGRSFLLHVCVYVACVMYLYAVVGASNPIVAERGRIKGWIDRWVCGEIAL